jgi:protein-disulfide isomerase
MPMNRRTLVVLAAGGALSALAPRHALAQGPVTQTERGVGSADAKVTVTEFFSLTCGHCAAFARTTLPQVKEKLVATGKMRLVYWDYPLDQVALTAAMVARHLPAERYEPFILALLSTQDRWAFARGVNSTEEIWKMAALAGMNRAAFDKAIADTELRDWIIAQAASAQQKWKIDATPSFVVNGQKFSGDLSFDSFSKLVTD